MLEHLPLRVHPKMKKAIEEAAKTEGVRTSEYIRFLLKIGLEQREGRLAVVRANMSQTARARGNDGT
jgi:hypothetical protein